MQIKCASLVYFKKAQSKNLLEQIDTDQNKQKEQILIIEQEEEEMKDAELKELFLTKDELKFNTMIQEYILQMRKSQYNAIKNQAPNVIGRQCNFFISLLITAAIVFLNYDQLFHPQDLQHQLIPFKNLHEIERKVEYVFQHTLMKYTVLYPVNITQCESFIPFIESDTLCSEKSVQVKIKFRFDIGYKPDYDNLQYDPNNKSITGEYGQLQILSMAHERLIESETNGFMNSWSILEFEGKYNQIKQAVRPKLEQRVLDYIQDHTQNSNSIDSIGTNIKKALTKIIREKQEIKEPVSTKMLRIINHAFDKLLILLNMDPLFFAQEAQEKSTFSEQDVTEFYRQQVIIEAERNKIQTQIAKTMEKEKGYKHAKAGSKQKHPRSQRKKSQAHAYHTEDVRRRYKDLLKKTQQTKK